MRSAFARVVSYVCWPLGTHSRIRSHKSFALRTLAFLGVHPGSLGSVSLHQCGVAHQPSLRSLRTMMGNANSLPRREAGNLINRPVTIGTNAVSRHPRTGGTAVLLSTTTELLVVDLVSQHDPQANSQLARHRHALSPDLSAPTCGDRTAATADRSAPHGHRPRPRESATADYPAWSMHLAAAASHWSVRVESGPRS